MNATNPVIAGPLAAVLVPRSHALEKSATGWLRLACFLAILYFHSVLPPMEFTSGRMAVVWSELFRDFGVFGFFLVGGASLRAKVLADPRSRLPVTMLLKVAVAAVLLAAFELAHQRMRGVSGAASMPFVDLVYQQMYTTNLWFLVAYAFAGPLLLALDERTAARTFAVALLLYAVQPGGAGPSNVLHTISFAYVCMYIGYRGYGWQLRALPAFLVAAAALVARTWIDDYGTPVYPAVDALLRVLYGFAAINLLRHGIDRLARRVPSPKLANYMFVPYVIQFPLVKTARVFDKLLLSSEYRPSSMVVFGTFWGEYGFSLLVFAFCAIVSFAIANVLRRHDIRI